MLLLRVSQRGEILAADLILVDPLAREDSSLDIGQRLLHGRPGLVAHNVWPTRQIAVFGGVRNRITHPCQAPFVNQIHDQLHFVDAFEICDLRLIAGFN